MNTQAPFRKRCGGQGDICTAGSYFKNLKASDMAYTFAPNLSPLPLPLAGDAEGTSCLVAPGSGPGADWQSAFTSPALADMWQGIAQDLLTLQIGKFTKGAETTLGVCHKIGHKKYGALKYWHGTYGWTSNDSCDFVSGPFSIGAWSYPGAFDLGDWIFDSKGNLQRVTAPGTVIGLPGGNTGTPEPDWGTGNGDTTSDGSLTWTCCPYYHPPTMMQPDQTRYRTMAVDMSLVSKNGPGSDYAPSPYVRGSASASGSSTVGALTGVITSSISTTETDYQYHPGTIYDPEAEVATMTGGAGTVWTDVGGVLTPTNYSSGMTTVLDAIVNTDPHCMADLPIPNFCGSTGGGGAGGTGGSGGGPLGAGTIQALIDVWNVRAADLPGCPFLPILSDPNAYIQSLTFTWTDTTVFDIAITISKTETTASWQVNYSVSGPLEEQSYVFSATMTLSDPYTAQDVQSDIETNLLPIWKLNGPEPWRTDPWTSIMPLVCRREAQTAVSPLGFPVPAQNPAFDGAIIGAPHPDGSAAEGWFDFYFTDERFCLGDPGPPPFPNYYYGYGGTLADSELSLSDGALYNSGIAYAYFLPSNATHWTGNVFAHNTPRGAMIDIGMVNAEPPAIGSPSANAILVVKAAFTRLPVPSHNFARPCGADRVLVDEKTAQTFTSGLTLAPAGARLPDGGSFPALSSQEVLLAFTPGGTNDGIWTGVTQSGSTLTLPAKNPGVNFWDLPTDYSHPFADQYTEAGGMAAIVRYSGLNGSTAAAPLCGRQAVMISASGGGSLLTFDSPQKNLRTGDLLDCWTAAMSSVALSLSVTRVDDSNFTVSASPASLAGVVWATSHGAAAWYWNDDAQKFDLRYNSWLDSGRYAPWTSGTKYPAGTVVTDANNNFQTAGNDGTTGGSAPAWATTNGGHTSDGTITWTCARQDSGCTPSCLKFTPCDPQVFAFTPNGDVDALWGSAWFNTAGMSTFVADGVYGSRVQANVEFEIPDPLYQPPAVPWHSPPFAVQVDDGTCAIDGETIYAPPPARCEARCGPVVGAGGNGAGPARDEDSPAMPADALGGTASWAPMVQPANPGVQTYSYNTGFSPDGGATWVEEPWIRYANELGHGAGCRWAPLYYALLPELGAGK